MSFVRSLPGLLMYNSASRHTENKTKKHATSHTDRLATSSTAADLCPTHENLGMFYFAHFDFFKVWCFYKCIYCIIEYFPTRRNLPFWLGIDWKKKSFAYRAKCLTVRRLSRRWASGFKLFKFYFSSVRATSRTR